MKQTGLGSVVGLDGTVAITGTAIATLIESAEGEQRVEVDEFKDTNKELIGFEIADEREYLDLVLVPKAGTAGAGLNSARQSLRYPPVPARVTFTPIINGVSEPLSTWGTIPPVNVAAAPHTGMGGDYIYLGGARRTLHKGRAAFRMTVFRPMTSPLSIEQLLTPAT